MTAVGTSEIAEVEARAGARAASKNWYYRNRARVLTTAKAYYAANKARVKTRVAKAKAKNCDKVRAYQKAYREKHKEKLSAYRKAHYENNRAKYKEAAAARASTITAKKNRRARLKWRYTNDSQYRAALAARRVARRLTKSSWVTTRTESILGCTLLEFKRHIERQWKPGMTWSNNTNAGWHVDHKVPLSRFDFKCPLQTMLASHFTNLQPLWASDNMKKGTNFI